MVDTRKFHKRFFSRGCCFSIKREESHCPIRQILKPFPCSSFPRFQVESPSFPLVFTDLCEVGSWAQHCVLRLQLLGRQSRGRGTWKRAPRIVLQWIKEDDEIYNPLVCHFSSRSQGVREPRHPCERCCCSPKRCLTSNEIARAGSLDQIYRRHFR